MTNKFTNTIKDGEITGYNPDGTADYYLIGDHNRDHKYWQETISKAIRLLSTNPTLDCMILYGGVVSDSGSSQIDISAGAAVGKDTNGDVKIVEWPAQTNLVVPDDAGAQTWVVAKYESLLDSSTTRAHFNGETYHHVLEDSCDGVITPVNWFVTANPNGTPDSLICLGSFTMTAGTYAEVLGERSARFYPVLEDTIYNVFIGSSSFVSNTTGAYNTVIGYQALQANTIGIVNVAVGYQALQSNITGSSNTAVGSAALATSILGSHHTAIGYQALQDSIASTSNTAIGSQSLSSTTTGIQNTAVGYQSLDSNTTGRGNTAIGKGAGDSIITGTYNTCIGFDAQPTGTGTTGEFTLGDSSVTTLRCADTTISALSDKRDKKEIQDMDLGLEFINALKPRKFKWDRREYYAKKNENGKIQYNEDGTYVYEKKLDESLKEDKWSNGFIAQEIQEVQKQFNAEHLRMVLESNPNKLEVAPLRMFMPLVKAVQELSEQVEALKNK